VDEGSGKRTRGKGAEEGRQRRGKAVGRGEMGGVKYGGRRSERGGRRWVDEEKGECGEVDGSRRRGEWG